MQYREIDSTTVELKFFGEIGYWYQGASDFTNTFAQLEAKYSNIIILVHCYGGYVTEGNVIFNAINQSKANVEYRIVGVSASMSTICQMGANKVTICENGLVMIHRPSGSASGNADDMFSQGKLLKSMEANFKKVYAMKKPGNAKAVESWFDGADHWFTASEAKDLGLVDEIIPAVVKDISSINKPSTQDDAEKIYLKFAATLKEPVAPVTASLNNTDIYMKELIITMFLLEGLTKDSSDTAVLTALKAKLDGETSKVTSLTAKLAMLEAGQTDTLIAAAETASGKPFEAEQKENLKKIGAESLAALKMALSFLKPTPAAAAEPGKEQAGAEGSAAPAAPSAMSFIKQEAKAGASKIPQDRAAWTWSDWCEKDEKGLLALGKDDQNKIYKASYGADMPKD